MTIARTLVAVAVVLFAEEADAERPCVLGADVRGEPALVLPVVELLRQRGLAVEGHNRCTLDVALGRADGQIFVIIVDREGRAIERFAVDAPAAATAIESWARLDVADPLLAARERKTDQPWLEASTPTAVERHIELAVEGIVGSSSDRGWWTGGQVKGCVHLGPTCVGALARYARDDQSGGDSAALATSRAAVDLALIGEIPIELGRVTLAPGAAIGQRTLRATRTKVGLEDEERVSLLRLGGSLAASLRLTRGWSLRLELEIDYTLGADSRLGNEGPGGGDPDNAPLLAGAPRWLTWTGLGIAYGGL